MGNTACCENPIQGEKGGEVVIVPYQDAKPEKVEENEDIIKAQKYSNGLIPEISEAVIQNLARHRPFEQKLTGELKVKKFGSLVYEGQLNQNQKPHGYGKMYYPNGSVFVGQFEQGLANGQGHYVFPNGSYYSGKMKNNRAEDVSGVYQESGLKYTGTIRDNQITGFGKQEGENYVYEGHFQNGKIKLGKLVWTEREIKKLPLSQEEVTELVDLVYEGSFDDDGNFEGQGSLTGPRGKYVGHFKKGVKDGQGSFQFSNKLRYEGGYKDGIKNGSGTLYSTDGKVAYCGEFFNGLPHGKGWIPLPDGTKNYLQFNEGISCLLSQKE